MESSVAQLVKLSVTVSGVDGSPPAGFFFIFSFHFSLYRLRNMMFPFYDKPSGKTVKYFTIAFFLLLSHFRENGNDALPKSSIFSQLIYRFTICVNKFLSVFFMLGKLLTYVQGEVERGKEKERERWR